MPLIPNLPNPHHPFIVSRDMPSYENAKKIADSSTNGNTGLWIVANDQTTRNRRDAEIRALVSGILDVNDEEIPTSTELAYRFKLKAGTIVRIFSANDFRVVK